MKNHIVAPSVVARNLCLKPGRCGLNPVPVEATSEQRVGPQGRALRTVLASHDGGGVRRGVPVLTRGRLAEVRGRLRASALLELILHASEPTPFPLDLCVSVPRVSSTWTATNARGTTTELLSRSMHRTGHLRGSTRVREQCAHPRSGSKYSCELQVSRSRRQGLWCGRSLVSRRTRP